MRKIGIIPARFGSTRFPGKPLVEILGKPMIQHVCDRVGESNLDSFYVATDDHRIVEVTTAFGAHTILTSPNHPSGTDRCGEAAQSIGLQDDDIIVNIQGDEPFIQSDQINSLLTLFDHPNVQIATLVKPIDDLSELQNPNKVKVVFSEDHKALYFSRSPIPFLRETTPNADSVYFKHIGIYGYRYSTLKKLIKLPVSRLEQIEKLEQLRWLENHFAIYVAITHHESIAIDTPEDLNQLNLL